MSKAEVKALVLSVLARSETSSHSQTSSVNSLHCGSSVQSKQSERKDRLWKRSCSRASSPKPEARGSSGSVHSHRNGQKSNRVLKRSRSQSRGAPSRRGE